MLSTASNYNSPSQFAMPSLLSESGSSLSQGQSNRKRRALRGPSPCVLDRIARRPLSGFFRGNTQSDANSRDLRGGGGLERRRTSGHRAWAFTLHPPLSNLDDGGVNRSRATVDPVLNIIQLIIVYIIRPPGRPWSVGRPVPSRHSA